MAPFAAPSQESAARVKLSRFNLACLLFCLAAQSAVPASFDSLLLAQSQPDATARITASLNAIVAGDTNAARREAIVAQLKAAGVDPVIETFGEGRAAGANVVVTLPVSGTKTIVIGAHLDRVSVGRGAVDNGGSCAVLIELVAAFKASPLARSTLRVVFFDREENGLRRFAHALLRARPPSGLCAEPGRLRLRRHDLRHRLAS